MKRLLCTELPHPGRPAKLPEAEAEHAVRVLRLRDGDLVEALDGRGHSVQAVLRVRGGPPRLETTEVPSGKALAPTSARKPLPITLEMAVLKGDAMEWVIEKAVELGVKTLAPTLTAHTVVQMKNKGPDQFRERWQKIADQALKQCGRLERMEILMPASLDDVILRAPKALRLWADEAVAQDSSGAPLLMDWILEFAQFPAHLLIGPEGGWSHEEREFLIREKIVRLSLGALTLRAETAAIFGCSLLSGAFYSSKLSK